MSGFLQCDYLFICCIDSDTSLMTIPWYLRNILATDICRRVLYFCESLCLSRWGALFLWFPLPLTFRGPWFLWVSLRLPLGCFIFVSLFASHVEVLHFRESPCDLDYRFSKSRIPQWFFSIFFSYSVHQITLENTLKSSLLLEMKFDLEIPIFKVNNVSKNFKTFFYVCKTSSFA